jgi:hypothetical protein
MKTLSAKAKISGLTLIGILAFVTTAIAAPHDWVLKTGETVSGDYVSSGTTKLVIKTGGTNCFLNISDLSVNDLTYIIEMQMKQRQARLDAETEQMKRQGMVEINIGLIRNFPEKVRGKTGWMDAEFIDVDNSAIHIYQKDLEEDFLGFRVKDKSDKLYYTYGFVKKNEPVADILLKLKPGDKIRLIGMITDKLGNDELWFPVDQIEMIETSAEKKAKEEAAP